VTPARFVLLLAALLGLGGGLVIALSGDPPLSDHVYVATARVPAFGTLREGSDVACELRPIAPAGALDCRPGARRSRNRLWINTSALRVGSILDANNLVELEPDRDWVLLSVPAGSPAPVGGEAAWIYYTLPAAGVGAPPEPGMIDGIAIAEDSGRMIVAVTRVDAARIVAALAVSPSTTSAVRAIGPPSP